jgi:MFS transporter, YNFM family, putative membrane transport protein
MANASEPRFLVRGAPDYRRATLALFLAGFSSFAVLYCVQPLLPVFAQEFGVSSAQSALPLSLATALLAAAILVAAAVSEGFGRRGLMFVSMALASILTVAAALAPSWTMLLALRAVAGFGLGGVPAVAMTYLAEETEPKGLGFAMGLYVGGTAFGGMVGRVGTGVLTELFGWRVALFCVGAVCLVAAAGFLWLLPASRNFTPRRSFDPRHHLRRWAGLFRPGPLPLLFFISFVAMGAFITVYNYAGFRLMAPPYNLGHAELGLLFLVYVFGIASSATAGFFIDRFGRRIVLPAGLLVTGLGVALTLLPGLAAIAAGIVVLTIGFFFSHSVASSWVGRAAGQARGHASALYLLAYYLGASIAGWVGGWFWDWAGWPGVAGFTLALLCLGVAAALGLARVARPPA